MSNSNYKKNTMRDTQKIKKYIFIMLLFIVFIFVLSHIYEKTKSNEYYEISENANVEYKVYLNDNEFYEEEYRDEDKQYIASLIKNIIADFNYELEVKENTSFDYTYRVDATINIIDSKTNNSLYESTSTLVGETTKNSNGSEKISISEEIDLDYSEYNSIASNFLSAYSLSSGSEATLDVILYAKTEETEESTITLSIPLAENTISIDTSTNLVSTSNLQVAASATNTTVKYGSIIGIIILISGVAVTAYALIAYILDTRTEEAKYKSSKKRILMMYGDVINKADRYELNLEEYYTIKLSKFVDLVKIKEDIAQPILMIEEEETTIFFIPSNTNFMYIFVLGKERELLAEKNEIHEKKIYR